jgi:hypothetical protein
VDESWTDGGLELLEIWRARPYYTRSGLVHRVPLFHRYRGSEVERDCVPVVRKHVDGDLVEGFA